MSARVRNWNDNDDRLLAKMAAAGWSVHMIGAPLKRLPYDVETRAAIFGYPLPDRTAEKRCAQCNRPEGEDCPYAAPTCPRKSVRHP